MDLIYLNDSIDLNDYFIVEKISKDKFSIWRKAIEKKTGKYILFIDILIKNKEDEENIRHFKIDTLRYVRILSRLYHPAIIKILQIALPIFKEKSNSVATIITRFYENYNAALLTEKYLDTNGQNKDNMNPLIRSKIIYGVASAMKYLHNDDFIVKILTLDMVLLNSQLEPKLSLMRKFSDSKNCYHLAPEIINNGEYSKYSDVYSFGFLIYKMFSNEIIFGSDNIQSNLFFLIKNLIFDKKRPPKPKLMPDCYWDLVCACISINPSDRPTFHEIVETLSDDKFAINEFGMETDIEQLHEYRRKLFH